MPSQIKTFDGKNISLDLPHNAQKLHNLTAFPALIDPHVHFRIPGLEHKEDWITASQACIAGGVTTVLDMPNTIPSCISKERLVEKKQIIEKQLLEAGIPLRFGLYFGASEKHFQEIERAKEEMIGIKVFMASSTGDLLISEDKPLSELFKLASELNLLVAVHAEDEEMIQAEKRNVQVSDSTLHSVIRSRQAALKGVERALDLALKYGTKLYILHVGTKEELRAIKQAKRMSSSIYAETTPLHLFLSEKDYPKLGNKVVVNPPIRTERDQDALWEAIKEGVIDTIGTDHAPHTVQEKALPYSQAPSGAPGVETLLPLLLNAWHEGKISLEKIAQLTRFNPEKIFNLPKNDDLVLVDLHLSKVVEERKLKTKCGWSPYAGRLLKGWPVYTILKGKIFHAAAS